MSKHLQFTIIALMMIGFLCHSKWLQMKIVDLENARIDRKDGMMMQINILKQESQFFRTSIGDLKARLDKRNEEK